MSPPTVPPPASSAAPPAVAILGGGPIGLTLALLLARREIASTVCEARPPAALRGDARLLALSRGTLEVLEPLWTAPPRLAAIRSVHVSSAGEFGQTRIDAEDFDAGRLGATVRYGELVAALAAAAQAQPRITLRQPARVEAVLQSTAQVRVRLAPESGQAGEPVLHARLAVHAEGQPAAGAAGPPRGARVETPAARPSDDPDADWAIVADLVLERAPAGVAWERFTRAGPLAVLPAPERADAASLVWCMPGALAAERLALDDAAFRAQLAGALGPRTTRPLAVGPRSAFALRPSRRALLREHRVVHVGNAAQTLHPVAGQGYNLGVRDCVQLADALAQGLGEDPAPASADPWLDALMRYESGRRADRAALGTITTLLPAVFSTRLVPVASARSLGLAAIGALPPLRRGLAHLLMFGVRS